VFVCSVLRQRSEFFPISPDFNSFDIDDVRGDRFTIQIDQLQQNVPINEARFTPPPTQKPPN
jgi:hypothetical protein